MTYFDKKTFRNGVKKSMNRLFFRILSAFLWVFCLCMWSCAAEPLLRVEDVTLPPEGESCGFAGLHLPKSRHHAL